MVRLRVFIALAAAMGLAASVASAQTVGIATGPQGTPTNAAGSAIAKVVNEASGLQTRALPYTSNEISMPVIGKGQVDMGISSPQLVDAVIHGYGDFKGAKIDTMRIVSKLYPLQVGIVVHTESGIKKLGDMKGKRLSSEFKAQPFVVQVAEALLANVGMTYKDVVGVPVPNTTRAAEDLVQGKSDGAFMALGAARMSQMDSQVRGGVQVLPIDTSPAAVERMEKVLPGSYPLSIAAGSLPGVKTPITIMAYDLILVASTHTKDDVVYKAVKAMHQGKDKLAAVFGAYKAFDPKKMYWSYKGYEYHPGAIRYFKEVGLSPVSK